MVEPNTNIAFPTVLKDGMWLFESIHSHYLF